MKTILVKLRILFEGSVAEAVVNVLLVDDSDEWGCRLDLPHDIMDRMANDLGRKEHQDYSYTVEFV